MAIIGYAFFDPSALQPAEQYSSRAPWTLVDISNFEALPAHQIMSGLRGAGVDLIVYDSAVNPIFNIRGSSTTSSLDWQGLSRLLPSYLLIAQNIDLALPAVAIHSPSGRTRQVRI